MFSFYDSDCKAKREWFVSPHCNLYNVSCSSFSARRGSRRAVGFSEATSTTRDEDAPRRKTAIRPLLHSFSSDTYFRPVEFLTPFWWLSPRFSFFLRRTSPPLLCTILLPSELMSCFRLFSFLDFFIISGVDGLQIPRLNCCSLHLTLLSFFSFSLCCRKNFYLLLLTLLFPFWPFTPSSFPFRISRSSLASRIS